MSPRWPAATAVLAFQDEQAPAQALATALRLPLRHIERHRFPDGELKLTLPTPLQSTVLLYRSLHQPNEKLVELLISGPAARALGAERVLLVCPYLAYMRQDIAFHPGEAVSQRHIASLLASRFDGLVTVDPHLHRIASLDEVMPGCRAVSLSAAGLLGPWVCQHVAQPLLLGPDGEAEQWVREAASASGCEGAWCLKERHGDRDVTVRLPDGIDVHGRAVVLIDDMASTGRTLVAAARLALAAGAASVDVAVTHGLFVGEAMAELAAAGVRHVWSSDCVPHASNAIPVAPLLAQGVEQVLAG
ncbi:ribose-phosphate diphosphokinase [Ideonella sp. B508-1]|uniref:ribose-phosphate diphosphokinase n=1 Tax=Ideonella sp. B508-1 TaxID=137716 RepID=UPI00034BBA8E|nr:ribose-phosphate diphosphokinase [Ideonella sp. B508-1]